MIAELYNIVTARAKSRLPGTLRHVEERCRDGEKRMVIGSVAWEDYLRIDEARGTDCSVPKFYWHDDQLEIMGTSPQHEKLKIWIASLLDDFLLWLGMAYVRRGQSTMQKLKQAGAEPDDSWCLKTEKAYPDLVLEIALTSGGLPKLEIYRRFRVPEVWMWRKDHIEVWHLKRDKTAYDGPAKRSRLLPKLDMALLESSLARQTHADARRAFQKGLGIR